MLPGQNRSFLELFKRIPSAGRACSSQSWDCEVKPHIGREDDVTEKKKKRKELQNRPFLKEKVILTLKGHFIAPFPTGVPHPAHLILKGFPGGAFRLHIYSCKERSKPFGPSEREIFV